MHRFTTTRTKGKLGFDTIGGQIAAKHGGMEADGASRFLADLAAARRYQRIVY